MKITLDKDISKITLTSILDRPGTAAEIFSVLGRHGIGVGLISTQSVGNERANLSFIVSRNNVKKAMELLSPLQSKVDASGMSFSSDIAEVAIMIEESETSTSIGTAGRVFSTLSKANINIDMISSSLYSLSCVIPESKADIALKALKKEFNLTDND